MSHLFVVSAPSCTTLLPCYAWNPAPQFAAKPRVFFCVCSTCCAFRPQKCTWKCYSNSCNTGSMHKRQSTSSLVDLPSLKMLLIWSTLNTSSEGSGGTLPLGKGASCTFLASILSRYYCSISSCSFSRLQAFRYAVFSHWSSDVVRALWGFVANVFKKGDSRKVTETLASDQNGDKGELEIPLATQKRTIGLSFLGAANGRNCFSLFHDTHKVTHSHNCMSVEDARR